MFRERARLFIAVQFLADILLTFLAFPLAYVTRLHLGHIIPTHWIDCSIPRFIR